MQTKKTPPTYVIFHERQGHDGNTYRRRLGGLWENAETDRINGGWMLKPSKKLFDDGRIVLELNRPKQEEKPHQEDDGS